MVHIKSAFILAAGFGTRLRPLTLTTPKPLIKVGGQPMLARAIAALEEAGVTKIIVNSHYLPEQIEAFVRAYCGKAQLFLSDERAQLLDSGGGVAQALPLLENVFFVLNADTFFKDEGKNNLLSLAENFKEEDCRMLLATRAQSVGFTGKGDFTCHEDGTLTRGGPFIYAGAHILRKSLFTKAPPAPFSLNYLWDRAKLKGQVLQGTWYHIGDEPSLREAEQRLKEARS